MQFQGFDWLNGFGKFKESVKEAHNSLEYRIFMYTSLVSIHGFIIQAYNKPIVRRE